MLKLVSPNFSDLLTPNIEIGKFPDNDSHVRILNLNQYQNQKVILYHRLFPKQNTNLIVLLLILDTLRAIGAEVEVVAPYLPYARQDKTKLNGEIGSAQAVCNLLARAGCQKLYTFDCHFLNAEGEHQFGELKIHNTSMAKALVNHAKQYFPNEPFELVVPDTGAEYLVKDLGGKAFKKIRKDYTNEQIAYRDIETLTHNFDIADKNFLVLDDMVSTGGTMVMAIGQLKTNGAKKVVCGTTHGLFLFNCLDKLQKITAHIVSTDTIPSHLSAVSIKNFLP